MKRRPFILLEALIAIALLSSALIPISGAPYKRYAQELALLRQFELERLSQLVFATVLGRLPELVAKGQLLLDPCTLSLDPLPSITYTVTASLTPDKRDTNEADYPYHLWLCTITFTPPSSLEPFTITHTLFTQLSKHP